MSATESVRGALVAARDYLARCANPETTYGYYPGGDPRNFFPDYEVCTEEEIAAWKEACSSWERGETPDPGGPHKPLPDGRPGHLTIAHCGMGTYQVRDEEAEDVLDQLDAAIASMGERT